MMNHQQEHFSTYIHSPRYPHIAILHTFTKFNLKTYVSIKFLSHLTKPLFI